MSLSWGKETLNVRVCLSFSSSLLKRNATVQQQPLHEEPYYDKICGSTYDESFL